MFAELLGLGFLAAAWLAAFAAALGFCSSAGESAATAFDAASGLAAGRVSAFGARLASAACSNCASTLGAEDWSSAVGVKIEARSRGGTGEVAVQALAMKATDSTAAQARQRVDHAAEDTEPRLTNCVRK